MEARGIRDAFFPETKKHSTSDDNIMLVGSVKTAVGHTEGTAGLAGLIKVSNALRRGLIPPNMLFEKLNPKLLPLTSNLRVCDKGAGMASLAPQSTTSSKCQLFRLRRHQRSRHSRELRASAQADSSTEAYSFAAASNPFGIFCKLRKVACVNDCPVQCIHPG